jgi:TatD DNase family protein
MKPRYFDIHSHLNFPDYEKDLDEVVKRLKETETHTIVVGTDYESSAKGVDLADRHPEIYACIGIHPINDSNKNSDISLFSELVKHPKVVAIGECGMDFFHAKREEPARTTEAVQSGGDYERQKDLFVKQIEFALAHDKPLMIHGRPTPGTMDAYEDILSILNSYFLIHNSRLRGNVHFFAGNIETAKRFFNIGFTISFTGVITFVRDYDEVIKSAPLNMIMSETDAPFVTPEPYRGKRNEPSYVREVVKRIALIRGEEEEDVRVTLVNNAFSMLG